jgi:Tol biopolymer transport system component
MEVWCVNRDGSGLEQLTSSEERALYPVWSPDGAFLAHQKAPGLGSVIMSLREDRVPPTLPLLDDEDAEFIAWSWSSDGRRLAGWKRRKSDGRDIGIVVYSFESENFESLTEFGRNPVWLEDGKNLVFGDDERLRLFLVHSETKRIRELTTSVPTELTLATISPDDRYIYASIRTIESDIWLLTLH